MGLKQQALHPSTHFTRIVIGHHLQELLPNACLNAPSGGLVSMFLVAGMGVMGASLVALAFVE